MPSQALVQQAMQGRFEQVTLEKQHDQEYQIDSNRLGEMQSGEASMQLTHGKAPIAVQQCTKGCRRLPLSSMPFPQEILWQSILVEWMMIWEQNLNCWKSYALAQKQEWGVWILIVCHQHGIHLVVFVMIHGRDRKGLFATVTL